MRVRITRRPTVSYDLTGDSLRIGRIYDLPSEFACALVIEVCAELVDHVSAKENSAKEKRRVQGGFTSAQVHDRASLFGRRKPPQAEN